MKFSFRNVVKVTVAGIGAAALAMIVFVPRQSQNANAAADAAATYKAKCASCHGADGSGNTAIGKKMNLRDLRSPEVQKQTDAQLREVIAKGKGKMPGYEKSLSADDLKGHVAYIRTLAKK